MSTVRRSVLQLSIFIVLSMAPDCWSGFLRAEEQPTDAAAAQQPASGWAEEYFQKDPLADKKVVTLEDLEQALRDEGRRDTVIERHFARATALTTEQRVSFLRKALRDKSPSVGRQAAAELDRMGRLEEVVAELFLEMVRDDRLDLREAAVVGLELIQLKPGDVSEPYLDALIEALTSEDRVRQAAQRQLEELGPQAVPALLRALDRDDPDLRQRVASELTRIVGSKRLAEPVRPAPPPDLAEGGIAPPPKSPPGETATRQQVRNVNSEKRETVRVYYGTNREKLDAPANPWKKLLLYSVVLVTVLGFFYVRVRPRSQNSEAPAPRRRRGFLGTTLTLLCLPVAVWSFSELNATVRELYSHHQGVKYGPRRGRTGDIFYGFCDVSIPQIHEEGKIEQPLLGAEDESKHVVIKETALMSDEAFYVAVKEALSIHKTGSRDCFVFVHGYCNSFEDAARRTAQIHYDLRFEGVPMFYSWPSRGSVRHYFSDRNEIRYSHEHVRRFLKGLLENVDTDRIHVIAHSMGADAFCQAIAEMDPQGRIFDQIILAAPDIDVDVFKQQIVPRLTDKARRTTLYCSRKDWALHASYTFNDTPRLGDSNRGILVMPGLDTIDASTLDTELLGHSYYGDCLPLLEDVAMLFEKNLAPQDRKLQPFYPFEQLPYWVFAMPATN